MPKSLENNFIGTPGKEGLKFCGNPLYETSQGDKLIFNPVSIKKDPTSFIVEYTVGDYNETKKDEQFGWIFKDIKINGKDVDIYRYLTFHKKNKLIPPWKNQQMLEIYSATASTASVSSGCPFRLIASSSRSDSSASSLSRTRSFP